MTDERKKMAAPGGAQSGNPTVPAPGSADDTEAGGAGVTPGSPEPDLSARAWEEFPKQVQAAVTYAGENKYDYGPKLRNVDIEHTVVSAVPMTDEITRVVLEYRPTTKFKGKSGSEYLDVDNDGVIQARRQIRVPKESMPWVLAGLAAVSVIAAAVIVPIVVFVDDPVDTRFVAGRTLWVRSGEPRINPYVTYDAGNAAGEVEKYIIIPEGEGTEIAYVELTLINQTSGVVSLAIDTDAAEVTTDAGIDIRPRDPLVDIRQPVPGSELSPRLNVSSLPLWGDISLQEDQQVSGFLVFEVPIGSKIRSLRWSATDSATIRY